MCMSNENLCNLGCNLRPIKPYLSTFGGVTAQVPAAVIFSLLPDGGLQ